MPFDLINFFPCLVTEGVQGAIGKPLVFSCGSIPDYKKSTRILQVDYLESGGDLLSRAVSSQVPSALKGLTSVFGMGTGGTPSSLPPEMVSYCFTYPDNCTASEIQFSDHSVQLISRTNLKSSPRPISIIKLHTLPYFHR